MKLNISLYIKKITIFLLLFLVIYYAYFQKIKYKNLWYSPILGIETPDSDTFYREINKFQRENRLSLDKISEIISYLNLENSQFYYNFKGNHYVNMNIDIFPEKYSINNKIIELGDYDLIFIRGNKDILFKNNNPNICSVIILGYSGKNIMYVNTFNSFGIYISKELNSKKNKYMICKNRDDWKINIKSPNTIFINKEDFEIANNLISKINSFKEKNGFTSHQISSMVMSSNIKFKMIKYKNIYDDGSIVIDKNNNAIYSKNDSENKIKLTKNSFMVLYQDNYGKIGYLGKIDNIDDSYIIAIKKEKTTYIYDNHLSKLKVSIVTD